MEKNKILDEFKNSFEIHEAHSRDTKKAINGGRISGYTIKEFEKIVVVRDIKIKSKNIIGNSIFLFVSVVCFLLICGAGVGVANENWELFDKIRSFIIEFLRLMRG